MGGGITGGKDLRSRGLWYGRDQNSLGIGPLLRAVSLDKLRQRFATSKTMQSQLAGAHARLGVSLLAIFNNAIEARVYTWTKRGGGVVQECRVVSKGPELLLFRRGASSTGLLQHSKSNQDTPTVRRRAQTRMERRYFMKPNK